MCLNVPFYESDELIVKYTKLKSDFYYYALNDRLFDDFSLKYLINQKYFP